MAARMPITATTISSSTRVKPFLVFMEAFYALFTYELAFAHKLAEILVRRRLP